MEKIGVVGVGVLGGAVKSYFKERGHRVFCYDRFKAIGSIVWVNSADIIFICVPTPRAADNFCDVFLGFKGVMGVLDVDD